MQPGPGGALPLVSPHPCLGVKASPGAAPVWGCSVRAGGSPLPEGRVMVEGALCGRRGGRDGFALSYEDSQAVSAVAASAGWGSQVLLGPGCLARAMLRDSRGVGYPPPAPRLSMWETEPLFFPVFLNKEGSPNRFSRLCVLGDGCWGESMLSLWGGGTTGATGGCSPHMLGEV